MGAPLRSSGELHWVEKSPFEMDDCWKVFSSCIGKTVESVAIEEKFRIRLA